MPIDASIYGNLRPPEVPSMLDIAGKGMTLRQLAMQNDKLQREEERAQHLHKAKVFGEALEGVVGLSGPEGEAAYQRMRQTMIEQGIMGPDQLPPVRDEGYLGQLYKNWTNSIPYLEREKTKAEIDKLRADAHRKENDPMAAYRQQMMEERRQNALDRKVEKLQGNLSGAQDLTRSLKNIESKLGFQLEDYDPSKDDLPGVTVPGMGRVSWFSGKARELESAIAQVFNKELRDRSGAAVTTPEMERLRSEFASGKFNTEKELVGALAQYKAAVRNAMQDIERGANPDALREYQDRGGTTSSALAYRDGQRKRSAEGGGLGPRSAHAAAPPIKPGHEEDGYIYMGGDPGQPSSWKKAR